MGNGELVVETRGLTKRYGSGVLAVDRVQEPIRLVAQVERRPDVGDSVDAVELAFLPARSFPKSRKELDGDAHTDQPSSG